LSRAAALEKLLEVETHSVYPASPGIALGKVFKEHVRATGQPETFPTISTARPPDEGALVVLALDVSIDQRLRPERDMAPCPICSQTHPKWLGRGRLIWCEDTSAIYCLGPQCSTGGWVAGRVNIAENLFRQEDRERQAAADLAQGLAVIRARIDWIDRVASRVRRAEELQNRLGKLTAVRRGLLNRTKGGGPVEVDVGGARRQVGSIRGADFLRSTWRDVAALEQARAGLVASLGEADRADLVAWASSLAPIICASKLGLLNEAVAALRRASEHVSAAANFLSQETALTLAALAPYSTGAERFRVTRNGDLLGIEAGEKAWHARIDEVTPLPALP
jgi:hypothetical protein